MSLVLSLLAILLDLAQTVLLTLRFRLYIAQVRHARRNQSPWEEWAEGEGKVVLNLFESGESGLI